MLSSQQKIGKNLATMRKQRGLTQLEVAEKAGINPNYYAKVERGLSCPSIATLEHILKVLNASSSDVLPF